MRLLALLLLVGACSSDNKYVDMEKAICAKQWVTVDYHVRGDSAFLTVVCK